MWLTVFITLLQAQTVSPTLREALIAFFPEISNQNHLTNPLPSTFHLNYHLLKYLTLASTSPQIPPDFLNFSSKLPQNLLMDLLNKQRIVNLYHPTKENPRHLTR
ncbi:MAG: hypothetical protein Q2484_03515, partial [Candidatus Sedimenticola sp. (ex Thyasira tokunagai)]